MRRLSAAVLALLVTIPLSSSGTVDSETQLQTANQGHDAGACDRREQAVTVAQVHAANASNRELKTVSRMMQEIAAAVERETQVVDELKLRLAASHDNAEAISLIRLIEQTKVGIERQILQVQYLQAQSEGRLDDATELSKAIEAVGRVIGERTIDTAAVAPRSAKE